MIREIKFPLQNNLRSCFVCNQSQNSNSQFKSLRLCHSLVEAEQDPDTQLAIQLQNVLKEYRDSPARKVELALSYCSPTITEALAFNVLKRNRSDWKSAYLFFNWVSKEGGMVVDSSFYNEVLDILGRMKRFDEANQLLDEMSKREGVINEETYRVLVHRYAAAHKVDEAIEIFKKRRLLGLELHSAAFQTLLMALCRYKHVEVAETLLHSMDKEFCFGVDIKTMNIVLNGWCVLGNAYEAKRFWKDILASTCKPDLFTYGTFIKALTNKGKLGTALKLYRGMWKQEGCEPDVVICNCMIDALSFKKRIPEALKVFREMKERGCMPNVATYNSLIKHMCKIRRMEVVYELLEEMEENGSECKPNNTTFNYLLSSSKKPEEVAELLERMKRNGCRMDSDTYNLVLRLYFCWGCEEEIQYTWDEMEREGLGPDRRSYTIMIHGLYDRRRIQDALNYYGEMTSMGIVAEPRTEVLVRDMVEAGEK